MGQSERICYTQLFQCLYVDNAVFFNSSIVDKINNARKDKPTLLNGTDFVYRR